MTLKTNQEKKILNRIAEKHGLSRQLAEDIESYMWRYVGSVVKSRKTDPTYKKNVYLRYLGTFTFKIPDWVLEKKEKENKADD